MHEPETVTIEEVTDVLIDYRGKTPRKASSGIKLLTAKVIKDGRIADGPHEYISASEYDSWMRRGLPQQGDILITTEAPLGEVARLRTEEKVALAQRVILLRGKPSAIDQAYYFYALRSPFVQDQLISRATGTTVLGIKQSELRKVSLPYCRLETQRKISSILAAYDDLVENNLRRIAILEEMARTIYREWFVEFRYPGHASAGIRESDGAAIPEGWEQGTIGEISIYLNRGVSPKYDDRSPSMVLNQRCIRHGRLNTAPARTHSTHVPADKYIRFGDILINSTGEGTLGRVTQVYTALPDCTVDSHVTIVRPGEDVNLDYLGLSVMDMQSRLSVSGVGSTGQTELGRDVIANMPVLIPPRMIQDEFSELVAPMRRQAITLDEMNITLARPPPPPPDFRGAGREQHQH